MANARQKLFRVQFGGELLYTGTPLINDLPPLFMCSDQLTKTLSTEEPNDE